MKAYIILKILSSNSLGLPVVSYIFFSNLLLIFEMYASSLPKSLLMEAGLK